MTTKTKALLTQVLKLPPKSRASFAERILKSLEKECDDGVIDAIVEEAQRRWQAYKNGEIRGIPAEELFPSLRKKRLE